MVLLSAVQKMNQWYVSIYCLFVTTKHWVEFLGPCSWLSLVIYFILQFLKEMIDSKLLVLQVRLWWGSEAEDEMIGWQHPLNGHEFEQTPGDNEGQGSLACCSSWGHKDVHDWVTEQHWGWIGGGWSQVPVRNNSDDSSSLCHCVQFSFLRNYCFI